MLAETVVVPVPEALEEPGKIRVTWYTDPLNVWCWGCEPAVRRFETVYRDAVEVEVVMGGLFEDFGPIREQWARMSGGRWEDSVLAFLKAVADQHRMPIDADRMMAGLDDMESTWPACIAVKAAEMQGTAVGRRYLRALREAVYLDGRSIHRRSVQTEIASEIGLDPERFAGALEDGSAERAFRRDRERCVTAGAMGFPTFEMRRGGTSIRIEGWQPWEAMDEALRKLDPGLVPQTPEPTAAHVRELLRRQGRCATREITAIFGLTDDDAEILLEDLEARGEIARHEVGHGVMWQLPPPRAPSSGIGRPDAGAQPRP